jgi:hypothetical protein
LEHELSRVSSIERDLRLADPATRHRSDWETLRQIASLEARIAKARSRLTTGDAGPAHQPA